MSTVLETVEHLVRSPTRVALLQELREGPVPRGDLQSRLGVTRMTMSRLLPDLVDRGWIRGDEDGYRLTAPGRFLLEELESFGARVEIADRLAGVVPYFPADLDVDLAAFADGRVVTADSTDTGAPTRRYAALITGASRVRKLAHAVEIAVTDAFWRTLATGDRDVEAVLTPAALETALAVQREAGLTPGVTPEAALAEYERVLLFDGDVPVHFLIADDTVALLLHDDNGGLPALLETTSADVYVWAERTYESYRREATPVTPGDPQAT
jgi:predicted transcriptional regulator